MRVAMVELYGIGGTADYTACLAEALARRGDAVTVITSNLFEPLTNPPAFNVAPIFRYRIEHPRVLKAGLLATALKRTRQVLRTVEPDVIHVQGTVLPWLEQRLYLQLKRVSLVCTAHDVRSHESRPWLGSYKRFYGAFDWLICHSQSSKEQLRSLGLRQPTTVMPHGTQDRVATSRHARLEARRRLGLDLSDRVVLMFGYLRRYKGINQLLEAARIAAAWGKPLKLVVAGRPLYDVTAAVRSAQDWKLDVQWRLEYVPRDEVAAYFEAADVVTLPYVTTSDSGAFELAAAHAKPVVVTAAGGLVEAFERYAFGAVVPTERPEALARALTAEYRGEPKPIQTNSWNDVAAASQKVYAKLVATNFGRGGQSASLQAPL